MSMKYLVVLRNNWKKTAFGTAVLGYGIYRFKSYYEINRHMQHVAEVAAHSAPGGIPKSVVVILNPMANKKKCETLFKKYCEPLLNLAGYSVEVVRTNHVGHGKSLIEEMRALPDAIVVAGGDGTASEVVTGLIRRKNEAAASCPIAVLPLGQESAAAHKYLDLMPGSQNKLETVRSLTRSIMFLLNEQVISESVMQFDVIDAAESDQTAPASSLKPIYGLSRFSWGLLRDIDAVKDKYWYFGYFRHQAAALFNAFSTKLNWQFLTDFVYTPPCPGCQNCIEITSSGSATTARSYLKGFMTAPNANKKVVQRAIVNKNCDVQVEGQRETSQLDIRYRRNTDEFDELETRFLGTLKPGFSFMKSAVHIAHSDVEPALTLKSRTIQLAPTVTTSTPHSDYSFYIDGEEYDVRPIKVSLRQNAIKIFSDGHKSSRNT